MIRKRPFVWIFLLFGAGILMQQSARLPPAVLVPLTAGCLCAVLYCSRNVRRSFPCLFAAAACFVLLGWLYSYSVWKFPAGHIYYQRGRFLGREVYVSGTIISDVRTKETGRGSKTAFILDVNALDDGEKADRAAGKVLVNLFQDRTLEYGDAVVLKGKLHRPFEFTRGRKFSYRRYLGRKGVHWVLSVAGKNPVRVAARGRGNPAVRRAVRLRKVLARTFDGYLTPGEAGIMQAFILGDRARLPPQINDLFKRTGTAHILAISGQHVVIVAALFFLLVKLLPLKRRWQYLLTIVLLAGYALLTGAQPSVVRATVMAAVFLFSFVLERETDSLNSLALAGFLLLLIDPVNIFDIGFQLSFASVTAIILLYPLVWRLVEAWPLNLENKMLKFFCQSLVTSLAAWLGVAGMILYYFDIITPVTILANVVIVPLSSLIMVLGFGLLLADPLAPFLAGCCAVCVKAALNLMVFLTFLFEKVPGAYFRSGHFPLWGAIAYYLVLAGLVLFYFIQNDHNFGPKSGKKSA